MTDTFDIDAWLSGLSRVTKFVEVIGKPHLQAEVDALDAQLRRTSDAATALGIAEQIEALRVEMEASRVGFRVSSLDPERVEAILAEHPEDAVTAGIAILAEQIVEPAGWSVEQVRALCRRLGEGYFAQTLLAASTAAQQGLGVEVPFSSAASAILAARVRG